MTAQTGPARQGPTERCTCGHTRRDHSGRRDHREKYGPTVAGRPWCHACETECIYCPPDPGEDSEGEPELELTLDEARALADDLGLQLYHAQDALAFAAECCAIADREQRTITTADVREWLKGARCGRQLAAGAAGYCPSCGRGDVAPTAEEYEQQRQRAEQAEAAIARVRTVVHVADEEDVTDWQRGFRVCSVAALGALDEAAAPDGSSLHAVVTAVIRDCPSTYPDDIATAVINALQPGARITATLARDSEATVQRVIDLYERWVKAGPPPLGTSVSRWWDARLVELHAAILPSDSPEAAGEQRPA